MTKTVQIPEDDIFELRRLRDNLQDKVNSEQLINKKQSRHADQHRTTDAEREAQHGLDVVNRILKQL